MPARIGLSLVGLLAATWSVVPAAAIDEQGTISLSGNGTMTSVCPGCDVNFNVATTGYVAGVDGNPFTLAWATPSTNLTLSLDSSCGTGTGVLSLGVSPGTLAVSGAHLVYNGSASTANVTVAFDTTPAQFGTELLLTALSVSVTAPSVSFSFNVAVPVDKGALVLTPVGNGLCPTPTTPLTLNLSGQIYSVM